MTKEVTSCDGPNCNRIKGEANHWSKVIRLYAGGVAIADGEHTLAAIADARHAGNVPLAVEVFDACGSQCEQALIAKLREKQP